MTAVFETEAYKSIDGATYAPGKDTNGYAVFKLYSNQRGTTATTWLVMADRLTLEQATAEMERRVGRKLYPTIKQGH
jgi:hypothetical protein